MQHDSATSRPARSLDARALADLLTRTGLGSHEAFTQFMQATSGWAWAHAYALLRDWARAEDCVQHAYLEVWCTAARYESARGGAKGWMLSLLRHRALDEIRATESDRRRLELFELREYRWGAEPDTTSETALARLDGRVVREALQVLEPEERELILLSYWSGLSHSQIAESLGLPVGTVKSRLRRGLGKLREHVGVVSVAAPGDPFQ